MNHFLSIQLESITSKLQKGFKSKKVWISFFSAVAAFGIYLLLPDSCPEAARRTASIFVLAALFWAFAIIPLHATSMLVVLLLIFTLARPGGVLDMDKNGYVIFLLPLSSPVIILFFGGFMLARAIRKYNIDRIIVRHLINLFGNKSNSMVLGFMFTAALLSMWISNTATAAMMLAMVGPLILSLDADDLFGKALVLAIAFGANIGGIGTPIGTPPNAIALGILSDYGVHLDFLSWMLMVLPLTVIILFACGFILISMFRPKYKEITFNVSTDSFIAVRGKWVVFVSILTVILWLTTSLHKIPEALVALLAAGFLLVSGLLDKEDLRRIDWDILVLMWGGLALGTAVEISGLGEWIVSRPLFEQHGFILVVIFCILAAFLSNFISNTAAASLLLPIAMSIPGEDNVLLAIAVALSCSFAMAFPISTPPNAMAFSTNVINSSDMFKSGILISIISVVLVLAGFKLVITKALGLE